MDALNEDLNSWCQKFKQMDIDLKKREKIKKTYTHYDVKLRRMREVRSRKLHQPGYNESAKEKEKMSRNETKYAKAKSEYFKLNKDCFESMCKVLSNRFQIITPTVGRYMSLLQNLFGGISGAEEQIQDDPASQPAPNLQPQVEVNHWERPVRLQEEEKEVRLPISSAGDDEDKKSEHNVPVPKPDNKEKPSEP